MCIALILGSLSPSNGGSVDLQLCLIIWRRWCSVPRGGRWLVNGGSTGWQCIIGWRRDKDRVDFGLWGESVSRALRLRDSVNYIHGFQLFITLNFKIKNFEFISYQLNFFIYLFSFSFYFIYFSCNFYNCKTHRLLK